MDKPLNAEMIHKVWVRKIGNANPEWWVLRENSSGKVERVATSIDHQIALEIFEKISK